MTPEIEGKRPNPEGQENPYTQIPDLVRKSILGKPKDSRRTQRQLLKTIEADEYFDPVIIAVSESQKALLSTANQNHIKNGANLLQDLFIEGYGRKTPKEELEIRATSQIVEASEDILNNHEELIKRKIFQRHSSNKYQIFIEQFPSWSNSIKTQSQQVNKVFKIEFSRFSGSGDEYSTHLEEVIRLNQWYSKLDNVALQLPDDFSKQDRLVDCLKEEPNLSIREKLFTRKYADLSLEDMEAIEYPLAVESFPKITDYIIQSLSDNTQTLHEGDHEAIRSLFMNQTQFTENLRPVTRRNKDLLANLNYYQELLIYNLSFKTSDQQDEQLKRLLESIPSGNANYSIVSPLLLSTVSPNIDPDFSYSSDANLMISRHPMFYKATENHTKQNDAGVRPRMEYFDETALEYLRTTLLPIFKKRLSELGVSEKYKLEIEMMEEFVKQTRYSEINLGDIRSVFEENCGEEFRKSLDEHSEEIKDVTSNVWQDSTDKIHFLPMQEGVNTVEFTEDSVPQLMGLESISMVRDFSKQDWKTYISFKYKDTVFKILATLDQNGELEFRAPLKTEMPGLYTMLNHIAVLTFHDLVVQENKERETNTTASLDREPRKPKPYGEIIGEEITQEDLEDRQPKLSHPGNLPRIQSERNLTSDVYRATGKTPRRVELHKRQLAGSRDYQAAVQLYNEAIQTNASEETINWTREELEAIRKRTHRISEQKKLSLPSNFSLPTLKDPVTDEERYLETWVIEHSNPKPTDEELASPVKLYQRYYKNSSALASLDQMKPWFVGQ